MAKNPKYTEEEVSFIQKSLKQKKDYSYIWLRLNRKPDSIRQFANRKWINKKYCSLCKMEIDILKKKYCNDCFLKIKRDKNKEWYEENKDWWKVERYNRYRFWGNYEKVLKRDNYECVKCGLENKEHIKKYWCNITIDHIDWLWRNSESKNNNINNLQTLCLKCHWEKDTKRTKHYINSKIKKWLM